MDAPKRGNDPHRANALASLPEGAARSRPGSQRLLSRLTDDLLNGGSVFSVIQRISEFAVVEQLSDIGQRMKMLLKLTLRHEKQHHQIHWLIVQRLKIYARL